MRHRVTWTVCDTPPGQRESMVSTVYSDREFATLFSDGDRATLLAGQPLIAKAPETSAWPHDVRIERT